MKIIVISLYLLTLQKLEITKISYNSQKNMCDGFFVPVKFPEWKAPLLKDGLLCKVFESF